MHKFFLLLLIFILSGCASGLTPQQCKNIDGFKLGKIDGTKGRPASKVDEHIRSCPEVDKNAYLEGRKAGIQTYCSPELAFYEGKEGRSFYNAKSCDEGLRENLIAEYKKGRKVFLLSQQKREIEQQISKEQEAYQKDNSVVGDITKAFHLLSGTSPTDELQQEKSKVNSDILTLEANAPVSSTTLDMENAKVSYGIKAGGALLGTIIGFGSGHALQGRYKSSGWKWTVAESAALGALIVSTNKYCESAPNGKPSLDSSTSSQECSNSIPILTMLGFLGIRIWESVDLWSNLGSVEYHDLNSSKKNNWTIGIAQNGWLTLLGSF